jgi:hypothetical protein
MGFNDEESPKEDEEKKEKKEESDIVSMMPTLPNVSQLPQYSLDHTSNMVEEQNIPTCVYASTQIQSESGTGNTNFIPGYTPGDVYSSY